MGRSTTALDQPSIHVVPRHLRWEVVANGVTRPMVDWLCTKERAVAHALERARELSVACIVVERSDGSTEEEWLA